MGIVEHRDQIEIVQQNLQGEGRIASRALRLVVGLAFIVALILVIVSILFQRWLTGVGETEEIVGIFFLLPAALVLLVATAAEFSLVLPRRLLISANGIDIHFSPWSLRPSRHLPGLPGLRARVSMQRHRNYATYASGQISHAPIISNRAYIGYGMGRFGPVDEDQAQSLADQINAALEKIEPKDEHI